MAIEPYIVPATVERIYDQLRVGSVQLYQPEVGAPLNVQYTIYRYRITAGGTEDAPAGGGQATSMMQMGIPALAADAELAAAIGVISQRMIADADFKGLLEAPQ